MVYVAVSIAAVNVLAVVVIAGLGRRLSGTGHELLPPPRQRIVGSRIMRSSNSGSRTPAGDSTLVAE